jgi:hypothetical protein
MHEAHVLFDSICNSKWFSRTSFILFLNKTDIFKKKIHIEPVNKHFPDYTGRYRSRKSLQHGTYSPTIGNNHDATQAAIFFKRRFEALNRCPEKVTYSHFTHGTNTRHMCIIMNSVKGIILTENLRELNF